jgi:phage baseplate assembly protein W
MVMSSKGVAFYGEDFFVLKSDNNLIFENITRILLTTPGERVLNINFGCKLKTYIFQSNLILQSEVEDEIRSSIERWEPRVEILNITIETVEDRKVYLKLDLINKQTLEEMDYETILSF